MTAPTGRRLLAASALGIPTRAQDHWQTLAIALRERGPAPCADSLDADAWWPAQRDDPLEAVALCRACPVRAECAAYAMAARERDGIWGALTPEERV